MKTTILLLATSIVCSLSACTGFNLNGETPYGKFVTNPDGSVTVTTVIPAPEKRADSGEVPVVDSTK